MNCLRESLLFNIIFINQSVAHTSIIIDPLRPACSSVCEGVPREHSRRGTLCRDRAGGGGGGAGGGGGRGVGEDGEGDHHAPSLAPTPDRP